MDDVTSLISYAERPRAGGWSLRSALVRYAQPEPARAGAVLELVRRTDAALKPFVKRLEGSPHLLSREPTGRGDGDADDETVIGLVAAASALDRLGDVLADWAASPNDRRDERPDQEIDDIARQVFAMLGELGVARETRPPRRA